MYDYFTIGYFGLSTDQVAALLVKYNVDAIADVRSSPFSRAYPDFNRNQITANFSDMGIQYVFLGEELGARPKDTTCYEDGRVSYDLLSRSAGFRKGLDRLQKGRESFRIALMCAERDPITCHRSILVSRHLVERGATIGHILYNGAIESHSAAIARLTKTLGLSGKGEEHKEIIQKHAYDVQAKKIAFYEASKNTSEEAVAPRMI